tara:strand:- start:10 stop:510 length:501 start_codon:yes stop_codon:yes gene_type:complete
MTTLTQIHSQIQEELYYDIKGFIYNRENHYKDTWEEEINYFKDNQLNLIDDDIYDKFKELEFEETLEVINDLNDWKQEEDYYYKPPIRLSEEDLIHKYYEYYVNHIINDTGFVYIQKKELLPLIRTWKKFRAIYKIKEKYGKLYKLYSKLKRKAQKKLIQSLLEEL